MKEGATDPWLLRLRVRPRARVRLFCFPYAGAGASIFHRWPEALRADVEVLPVQIPGRETRYREPLHRRIETLAAALATALGPALDRPFAFFGYSLGALLAFETARELRRRNAALPGLLMVAAKPAPHCRKAHPPIADLPETEFLAKIREIYAPPEAAWRVPEVLQMMLPILRADMSIYDHYEFRDEPPLPCAIHAFSGENDRAISAADLQAWKQHTTGEFSARRFPGGHFFVLQQEAPLREAVDRHLGQFLSELGTPFPSETGEQGPR